MAYTPTNWKDRDVENPRTYTARQNEDGSITFFDAPGEIREQGTPVDSANMNKIEQGIVDAQYPDQSDNAGKFLTTDGSNPKWAEVVSTTITYWE